eukprot:11161704-Lingulodinium_polyedra.AAC.1
MYTGNAPVTVQERPVSVARDANGSRKGPFRLHEKPTGPIKARFACTKRPPPLVQPLAAPAPAPPPAPAPAP